MNSREKPSTLRMARLSRGYRLADVAERAGYTVSHLSGVERGKDSITLRRLVRVAGVLELTDEELGRVVRESVRALPYIDGRKDRKAVRTA